MAHVAVMGTGSWGTAFGMILADSGCDVTMWGRRQEIADDLNHNHRNSTYLPGLDLPTNMRGTVDAQEALSTADAVVLAVPSQTLRANLEAWRPYLPAGVPLVSLMKGVELGTTMRMSQVIAEVAQVPSNQVVIVSGPNLAREIAQRQPAASVVACSDEETAKTIADYCAAPYFRPYTHVDVVGIELSGATKNVVALAVGMAEGMGYGDNTKASLITRGLAETARLGVALGADPQTFMGLAGVGDLIATCMSPLSRNHTFGRKLGEGMTVEEVVADTSQTAEGVKSCQSILELAQAHGVDMPIVSQVVSVVRDGSSARTMLGALMTRDLKTERKL